MMRFQGKTAIVTGAASLDGIGFATAARLAREGARVLLTDIDGLGVAARAEELVASGATARGLSHDVSRNEDWQRVLDAAEAAFGAIDVLVNNAGLVILKGIDLQTEDEWRRQLDVNLTSVYYGCRAVIAHMRRHERGGAIINVSSIAGLIGMRRCVGYGASKGGVRLMSKALAIETAAERIRVNTVHPGVIETQMQQVAKADGGEQSARIHATIPMQRMGRPEEVAAAIAFLASDDAAYVTGTELVVDGGFTAQ
ncbi:oxidoreductase [Steroidobacter agaridevorans]|uniref:Oxidoreductase n=1 Tax=Steroidobacter agaridevorans TaxID=2695856 RepID=A0A829YH41_9GAMM|nr:SDR family NAD(P)-dependent oxidoreductase [Steroidobacter agaridevorans]GFE82052.1 oxidoreductase [Steroidobacter agaridevorans]GFE85559.1 oxidoreductase [Steroidobacter agaridevorans]